LHSPNRSHGRQGVEDNQARISGVFYPLPNIIDAAPIETPPGICQRQSLRPLRADRRQQFVDPSLQPPPIVFHRAVKNIALGGFAVAQAEPSGRNRDADVESEPACADLRLFDVAPTNESVLARQHFYGRSIAAPNISASLLLRAALNPGRP
jgi:hypothetical protein